MLARAAGSSGLLLGLVVTGWMASPPCGAQRANAGWARYRNQRWGFCVSYPSTWAKMEGADQSGAAFFSPTRRPGAQTSISVGALPNQPSDATQPRLKTLSEIFQDSQVGLREYWHAQQVVVLSKREEYFRGEPAMLTEIQYRDHNDGLTWIEETLRVNHDQVIFTFDLRCQPPELGALNPIFKKITRDFRFDCNGKKQT